MNDGPLWAGRGINVSATLGAALGYGWDRFSIDAAIAPTFLYSENRPFEIFPGREPGRSTYSSPWHLDGASADLPMRFGDRPIKRVDAGQSYLAARTAAVVFGVSSASEWWGPGVRNAIVLSNNAGGIPRLFVGTARPVKTRVGDFTGELFTGTLTKSLFFDTLAASDFRSISAFTVSYRPRADTNLAIGIARSVYVPSTVATPTLSHSLLALRWRPPVDDDSTAADQIASVFARWVFPASRFEVYGEWSRTELPRSFADLFETPYNTQGYTLGFTLGIPRPDSLHVLRLQSEISDLEQSIVDPGRPPVDYYTGRAAPQGYTQRGQIIGAAIGPGASSQWIALDYLIPEGQFGLFVGRIRWENDALYRQLFVTFANHDVTLLSGVRGRARLGRGDASLELTIARRYNYLFQSGFTDPLHNSTVRVPNVTIAARFIPR